VIRRIILFIIGFIIGLMISEPKEIVQAKRQVQISKIRIYEL